MSYHYVIRAPTKQVPFKQKREKCSGHFLNGGACNRYATVWHNERGLAGAPPRPFCKLHDPLSRIAKEEWPTPPPDVEA